MTHSNQQSNSTKHLYSDEAVSKKRNIIMDLLSAIMDAGKGSNPELWKLHIDAALDRLDNEVYVPTLERHYLPRKQVEEAITTVQNANDSNGRYNACIELRRLFGLTKDEGSKPSSKGTTK